MTEMIYPKIVEAYVKDDGNGLDFVAMSQDARERLSPLVPRKLLQDLDEAEQSGALGDTVTEIISDASDNGLGDAVNDVMNKAAESETGEKLRGVGETVGNFSETAGDAITDTMDAARDGVVGNTIDSALDAAGSGVVGDAMNDTVRAARIEAVKIIAERTSACVHLILLCLLWVGLMVALTIIKNTFGLATKLPVVKHVDKLGGAALGLVECAMVFWCLAWVDKVTGFGWLAQQAKGTVFLRLFV
ncbi:MAG: CvpA family protein [Oscillospiraceae bacterium]|nr:CvpA family protein [Oscillospiraceae bacterium]